MGCLLAGGFALMAKASAQCALCRAAVESASDPGLTSGLQAGIYLLLLVPYLLGGWIAYRWWRTMQ